MNRRPGERTAASTPQWTKSRLLTIISIAGLAVLVAGCASQTETKSAEEMEELAQGIGKKLMCPVCPSETIDQSQVQLAKQMRDIVREKLAAGESREEIFQFFVDRYGIGVLAEPPRSGFNLLVWVVPPIALVFGGLVLAVALRAMRRSHDSDAPEDGRADEADLEPYLSAVDREIQGLAPLGESASSNILTEGSEQEASGERTV